jgi:hypothetical protein
MISDFAAEITFAYKQCELSRGSQRSDLIVGWQVIVSVVVGDNVAAEIVWGAIKCDACRPGYAPWASAKPDSMFARTMPSNRNCSLQ